MLGTYTKKLFMAEILSGDLNPSADDNRHSIISFNQFCLNMQMKL